MHLLEYSIILGRDFNSRTGNLKDVIINEKNENTCLEIRESLNNKTNTTERIDQDKKINDFGYELRDVCISTNLNILNGRTIGELLGKYRTKWMQYHRLCVSIRWDPI